MVVLVLAGWLTSPTLVERMRARGLSDRRRSRRDLSASLELVAMLRVGVAAGMSARASLDSAITVVDSPSWTGVRAALDRGDATADVFGRLGHAAGTPQFDVVAVSVRYGLPLDPVLDRVEMELGENLRRGYEARARRLPVLLLFPLVTCVLPAFIAVGVLPVVIAATQS